MRDYGRLTADDNQILAHARSHGQAIISADTDFTLMRALRGVPSPSLVLLRSADRLSPPQQAALILANLAAVSADLEAGAAISIAQGRLRVRPLPMGRRRRERRAGGRRAIGYLTESRSVRVARIGSGRGARGQGSPGRGRGRGPRGRHSMDFNLPETAAAVREGVAEIGARHDRSYWDRCDQDKRWPEEVWADLAKGGWLGLCVPQEYGGGGQGLLELAVATETLSASGAGSGASFIYLLTPGFGALTITRHGTGEQKARTAPQARRRPTGDLLRHHGT